MNEREGMMNTPSDHEDRIRALEDGAGGGGGGGVTDHGALTGLSDDDHAQYHTDARGDARYSQLGHAHAESDITGLVADLAGKSDVGHTHSGSFATRTSVTITTGSLSANATEDSVKAMPVGFRLLAINVDRACRIRLYKDGASRTADASRPIGTDVDIATDHGLIFEYVADAAVTAMLSPLVDGYLPSGTDLYYSIKNRSGATSTVAVTFDYIRTE